MGSTMRPSRTARRARAENEHRAFDIAGVLLIAAGLVSLVSLIRSDSGIFGAIAGGILRSSFGAGAWVFPFLLIAVGIAIILGHRSCRIGASVAGVIILFISLLGFMARTDAISGDYFDPNAVAQSGGYVGAIVAWLLQAMLGEGKWIGLGALAMVGIILTVNTPLQAVLQSLRERTERLRKPKQIRYSPKREPKAVVKARMQDSSDEAESVTVARPRITNDAATVKPSAVTQSIPKEGYSLPPLTILQEPDARPKRTQQEVQNNIDILEQTLEEFGIEANVVEIAHGPTLTRYEIQLGPGIRVSRVKNLGDNLAMSLSASHVRVEAPIPGKAAIGVEVPNSKRATVRLREVADTEEFMKHPSRVAICLGQDVSGQNVYADLAKMPHLLIGGATNSGKSIGLATIITSLLMRNTPKDVKLMLLDPKRVELTLFDEIPHLLCPVVRDIKQMPAALRMAWREMDRRYDLFAEAKARNIEAYNSQATFAEKLPYIVVVIDELADLMIQASAEVETSICRLAQLARATGIHLIIATQRPSVDVITGTIKANISSRIAFAVSSAIDSRTILDCQGAENLIGQGDMLFLPIDANKPVRIQGCYISEKEIADVCEHWRKQAPPEYVMDPASAAIEREEARYEGEESDPFYEDAVRWVAERGQASTSMLQRRFAIGFQRASRLLDMMEERGIVAPRDGPRPREVLISVTDAEQMFGTGAID